MKSLLIIISAIVEFVTLQVWFVCIRFTNIFHYSALNIPYQIDSSLNSYHGMPMKVARLFHNKLIQIPIDILRLYLQFWDIRFGTNWFSLVGYFGIFSGLYYFITNKKKKGYHWVAIIILAILPCIEIFITINASLVIKSLYLWLPYCIFSLYGIYQFITHGNLKKRMIIVGVLLVLSIWWILIMPRTILNYCVSFR